MPVSSAEERLVLVDRLERPLADLRLVRRVRRVELAAQEHLVHDRRQVVAVDARAQEAREVGPVPRGKVARGAAISSSSVSAGGQVQAGRPDARRDRLEERVDGRDARARRASAPARRRCAVRTPCSGLRDQRLVGRRVEQRVQPAAGSARRIRSIQPAPYGSRVDDLGGRGEGGVHLDDLAADGREQVADGLHRLDDAEGRELVERRPGARAARRRRCRPAGPPRGR